MPCNYTVNSKVEHERGTLRLVSLGTFEASYLDSCVYATSQNIRIKIMTDDVRQKALVSAHQEHPL